MSAAFITRSRSCLSAYFAQMMADHLGGVGTKTRATTRWSESNRLIVDLWQDPRPPKNPNRGNAILENPEGSTLPYRAIVSGAKYKDGDEIPMFSKTTDLDIRLMGADLRELYDIPEHCGAYSITCNNVRRRVAAKPEQPDLTGFNVAEQVIPCDQHNEPEEWNDQTETTAMPNFDQLWGAVQDAGLIVRWDGSKDKFVLGRLEEQPRFVPLTEIQSMEPSL